MSQVSWHLDVQSWAHPTSVHLHLHLHVCYAHAQPFCRGDDQSAHHPHACSDPGRGQRRWPEYETRAERRALAELAIMYMPIFMPLPMHHDIQRAVFLRPIQPPSTSAKNPRATRCACWAASPHCSPCRALSIAASASMRRARGGHPPRRAALWTRRRPRAPWTGWRACR